MEEKNYEQKYKELKRKFKALQAVTHTKEHIKASAQLEQANKSINTLKRESR